MRRIKALHTPTRGKCGKATIIDFALRPGHEFSEDFYEAIWVDNAGHISHSPLSELTVDLDSLEEGDPELISSATIRVIDKLRDAAEIMKKLVVATKPKPCPEPTAGEVTLSKVEPLVRQTPFAKEITSDITDLKKSVKDIARAVTEMAKQMKGHVDLFQKIDASLEQLQANSSIK